MIGPYINNTICAKEIEEVSIFCQHLICKIIKTSSTQQYVQCNCQFCIACHFVCHVNCDVHLDPRLKARAHRTRSGPGHGTGPCPKPDKIAPRAILKTVPIAVTTTTARCVFSVNSPIRIVHDRFISTVFSTVEPERARAVTRTGLGVRGPLVDYRQTFTNMFLSLFCFY